VGEARIDIVLSAAALVVLAIPYAIIAALVKLDSSGPSLQQERMGLDGKAFAVYKFRSMYPNAEESSGPVWAHEAIPAARRSDAGCGASISTSCRSLDVFRARCRSSDPAERPFFVAQFKHRIPQYMLRHKVKAGITGWARSMAGAATPRSRKRTSTTSTTSKTGR